MNFGLTFKGRHSFRDFGLTMKSGDRSLLPETKRQEVDIIFLDGKIDLQKEPVYSTRNINVSFSYIFKDHFEMQEKKRKVAEWLSGRSKLIFDDEPDKYYDAKVYSSVSIEQTSRVMRFQVNFECSPFAFNDLQMQVDLINKQGQNINLFINGNVKTCGLITLNHQGTQTINSFVLRRERIKV